MAAVSIPPSPHTIGAMGSRRVPLSTVPNAANSPVRAIAVAASKRSRAQTGTQEDNFYDGPPPAKKQIIDLNFSQPRTPPPRKPLLPTESKVFSKRPIESQLTAFDRRLLAAKDRSVREQVEQTETAADEPYDTLRQWQKHYRKAFPSFVFYFESVNEEARRQYSKRLHAFGAREEKFFSKDVTHVVTTRSLPTEASSNGGSNNATSSSNIASHKGSQPRTINPSLLEKSSDLATSTQGSLRERFTFEVPNGRKLQQLDAQDIESRKQVTGSTDVLQKAKHMGMKIWQLEKFGRILQVMGQGHDGEIQSQHNHNTRSNALTKTGRQSDLSQLLRNEQLNGPADREVIFTSNDMVAFKGPYIFIRDMDEKTKPIMVREYPKVQSREQGAWPQFRSAPRGKCPFIEEVGHSRRETERAKIKEKAETDVQGNCEPAPGSTRERATNVNETIRMQPPPPINRKRPLGELDQGATVQKNPPQQLPVVLNRCSSLEITADDSTDAKICPSYVRPGLFGGEPMASGMQASNITSAIQSQMISSTSAAPGAKGGTSREVHGLQRKVLERTVAPSINKTGSVDKISDILATTRSLRGIPATRAAKLRAQENIVRGKLSNVKEKAMSLEQDEVEKENPLRQKIAILASREFERELKPGYCENCREKFEDFEDHILGRKHRKFAINKENWTELDAFLSHVVRPLREGEYEE